MKPGIPFNTSKLKTTVLVSGRFNVIHPGHLRLLKFAKECGDSLVVAVESDELAGEGAHVPEHYRLEAVMSHSMVDSAFIIHESVENLIHTLKPDIVVKGKEHESRFNPEADVLAGYGGRLLFSSGDAVFSSVDLIRREFQASALRDVQLPADYLARHNIARSRLEKIIAGFSSLNVVVIGDLILDEYIVCDALGMSQEDPTIVVTPIDRQRFVGGAGIVAAHASGLGARVNFFSIAGNDEANNFCRRKLDEYQVESHIVSDQIRQTNLKQRFRSKGKTLLRVNHLYSESLSIDSQNRIFSDLQPIIESADLVVFSDFNYGCLPQRLVDMIVTFAKEKSVMLVADSQSSSQLGDIGRFQGMDLITPTEREARISTKNHEDGLVVLTEKLRQQSQSANIFLKLGEEGLLIHAQSDNDSGYMTDRLPALNPHPKDVAGAGDSMMITGSMAIAAGATIWEAALLGSLAAAVQVGRVGNMPMSATELSREISA
jgi:rfaE bifunctional protein kinase chain/domain